MRDPYEVLNISREATTEEIDNAFQHLKERYHPSNYDDSALREIALEKYREVEEAYRSLRNTKSNYQSEYSNQNSANSDPFSSYRSRFEQWQQSGNRDWSQGGQQNGNVNSGCYGPNFQQGYGQRSPYYRSSCCSGSCMDALCLYCVTDACCDCICGNTGGFC